MLTRERRTDLLVVLACAFPRLVLLWLSAPPEPTFYWGYASALLRGGHFGLHGVPDTYVEPLYPAFLAAARWISADRIGVVLLAQIGVAAIGGVLLRRLTQSLTRDRRAAWIAVLLYALDPYLVRQSVGLMEVTLVTTLLIGVAWSAHRPLVVGCFLAAAILTRFSLLPLAILIPLWLSRRSWTHAAGAVIVTAALLTPWVLRNALLDGSMGGSRGTVNLAVSLSDAADQLLPRHNNDRLLVLLDGKTDEELWTSAASFVRQHPWRTLEMKARNFLHVFNPRLLPYTHEPNAAVLRVENGRYWIEGGVPRPATSEWIHALWRGALLAVALVGLWRRGLRWDDGPLWAVIVTITAVCTIVYPTTRLTTPMVFTWMVFAAVTLRSVSSSTDRSARRA
jgi:hypothetical protein